MIRQPEIRMVWACPVHFRRKQKHAFAQHLHFAVAIQTGHGAGGCKVCFVIVQAVWRGYLARHGGKGKAKGKGGKMAKKPSKKKK